MTHNAATQGYERAVNLNDFMKNQQAQLQSSPLAARGSVPSGKDGLPWFLCTTTEMAKEKSSASTAGSVALAPAAHRRTLPAGGHAQGGTVAGRAGTEEFRRGANVSSFGTSGGVHPSWRDVAGLARSASSSTVASPLATMRTSGIAEALEASQASTASQFGEGAGPEAVTWGSFPWLPQVAGSRCGGGAVGFNPRRDPGRTAPSPAPLGPHALRSLSRTTRSASTGSLLFASADEKAAGFHREGSNLVGFDNVSTRQMKIMSCCPPQDLRRVQTRSKYD